MDYATKLKNFPSVNYISLYENVGRQTYMEQQFAKYGIKGRVYLNKKYNDMRNEITVIPGHFEGALGSGPLGVVISHIKMIREWLETTDEEYAIFTEDDISFKSIEYWNFTWDQFLENLPVGWRCVQLIRMENPCTIETFDRMRLNLVNTATLPTRWWGSSWMMTREYAREIAEQHNPEKNVYNLWHNTMSIAENILLWRNDHVCNFPLLFENCRAFESTNGEETQVRDEAWYDGNRSGRDLTQYMIEHLWRSTGKSLNLKQAMKLS